MKNFTRIQIVVGIIAFVSLAVAIGMVIYRPIYRARVIENIKPTFNHTYNIQETKLYSVTEICPTLWDVRVEKSLSSIVLRELMNLDYVDSCDVQINNVDARIYVYTTPRAVGSRLNKDVPVACEVALNETTVKVEKFDVEKEL